MPRTARLPRRGSWQGLLQTLSSTRFDEVLVLQGAPLIGALSALPALAFGQLASIGQLVLANLLLVAHVFTLNDWAGIHGDLRDPHRAARTFAARGVSRTGVGLLALALLGGALLLLADLGQHPLTVGVAIAVLSALYSLPGLHWKGTPVFGTALHLLGGALHFLLGYACFALVDADALAVSGFFALVFSAGHLANEARDYEGDLANAIRTNATVFGRAACFWAGQALFCAGYALLTALALRGLVPQPLAVAAAFCPLQLAAAWRAWRGGLRFDGLRRLQWTYRALYAVLGLLLVATVLA